MKKLWNKFTNFLYKKAQQRFIDSFIREMNTDEEYFRKKLYKAVKYDPLVTDHEEWIPLRAKKEKDNV